MENNDNTFFARWLNNDLTKKELIVFKKSKDYLLFQKITRYCELLKIPYQDTNLSWNIILENTINKK